MPYFKTLISGLRLPIFEATSYVHPSPLTRHPEASDRRRRLRLCPPAHASRVGQPLGTSSRCRHGKKNISGGAGRRQGRDPTSGRHPLHSSQALAQAGRSRRPRTACVQRPRGPRNQGGEEKRGRGAQSANPARHDMLVWVRLGCRGPPPQPENAARVPPPQPENAAHCHHVSHGAET